VAELNVEAPEKNCGRGNLDHAVNAEGHENKAVRHKARPECNGCFNDHPREREIFEHKRPLG
jgi:hypothetical protein